MYILDIWGGELSQEHLARKIFDIQDFEKMSLTIKKELENNFLVNIRTDMAWGFDGSFDNRKENA